MAKYDTCLRALFHRFLEKLGNINREDISAVVRECYPSEEAFEEFINYFKSEEGIDRLTTIVSEEARKIEIH